MKKIIKISGIFVLSAIMFSVSNRMQDGETINLDSLIALNIANAEGGEGSNVCYDQTSNIGSIYMVVRCSDCRFVRCDYYSDKSTCN